MEEKKTTTQQKLSYEELNKAASELHVNYQKLMAQYQKAVGALNELSFDREAFLLQSLFKVTEHIELYSEDFAKWTVETIQEALTEFAKKDVNNNPGEAE